MLHVEIELGFSNFLTINIIYVYFPRAIKFQFIK